VSRRKKGRGAAEEANDIDLTPMLDVVFIMLIFFIVTASFVKEVGLDVNLPPPNPNPPADDAPQNILVRISADNQIWFRDETGERRVDERQVRSNIERLRAELPQASVIIQADRKANAGTYVAVQDAAQEAKAPNVVLVPLND
jgi:biopolymer transport protein ExbD